MAQQQIKIIQKLNEHDLSTDWVNDLEALQTFEKEIPLNEFEKIFDEKNIEVEFRVLKRITMTNKHLEKINSKDQDQFYKKNRYKHILPYDHSMPECQCMQQRKTNFEDLISPIEFEQPKMSKTKSLSFAVQKRDFGNQEFLTEELLFTQQNFKNELDNISEEEEDWTDQKQFYINASFIQSPINPQDDFKHIITQHPLENTIVDFWHMCFEQKVQIIVMLNQTESEGILDTEQYFPKLNLKNKFGSYEIENQAEMSENGLTYRSLKAKSKKETRIFTHYQYTKWEDKGTISEDNFSNLANFVRIIFKLADQKNQEIKDSILLIHCKAGIGRSGTFLALLFIYEKLKYIHDQQKIKSENNLSKSISIFSIVRKIREERWGLVQTPQQYYFLYNFSNFLLKNIKFFDQLILSNQQQNRQFKK